jgi:predicted ester cyclase
MIDRAARNPAEGVLLRLHDAMNQRDAEECAACYTDEASLAQPETEILRGLDAIAQDFRSLFRAFPDLTFAHRHRLFEGDVAAVEYTFSGTHQGALDLPEGALEPTGRGITLECASFLRVAEDGRIAEERRYYDLAGFLGQLGAKG